MKQLDQLQELLRYNHLQLTAYTGNWILEYSQQKRSYTKQHKLRG